jgi:hypothetical protein
MGCQVLEWGLKLQDFGGKSVKEVDSGGYRIGSAHDCHVVGRRQSQVYDDSFAQPTILLWCLRA